MPLLELMRHDGQVKKEKDIVSILVQIGAPAIDHLKLALRDTDPYVCRTAGWALAYMNHRDAWKCLTAAVKGRDPDAKKAASGVLREIIANAGLKKAEAFSLVEGLWSDVDSDVRKRAVSAMELFGPFGPAKALLIEALDDPDPGVRAEAARVLASIKFHKAGRPPSLRELPHYKRAIEERASRRLRGMD
jgi:HEAT repeat protein